MGTLGEIARRAEATMWHLLKNFIQSLRTYPDLGPDLGIRRQVNAKLRQSRANLAFEAWADIFAKALGNEPSQRLLRFIHAQLAAYSGLAVGRIRPSDRLIEDLQLPLICWFDWPNQLCDDFYATFQIDISEEFDEALLPTMRDLVAFLNEKLRSMDSLPTG